MFDLSGLERSVCRRAVLSDSRGGVMYRKNHYFRTVVLRPSAATMCGRILVNGEKGGNT